MKLLIVFVILSIINVVFSTIRSIATVNGGKLSASLLNGGYFAFYNIMLLYTVMDFPMWQKCLITFACNVVGVYIVKLFEEKARKDKMWRIEFTVPTALAEKVHERLASIPHNYIVITDKHTLFNCYCATQSESIVVRDIVKCYDAKWFVSESKNLFC